MFSLNRIRMNSKKMRKKIGFIKLIQLWGIVFLTALVSVIVGIDLVTTYYYSNIRMNTLRTDLIEQQKQMSKREVERVVGMMNYDRMQNDALKGTKSYVNVEKLQAEWMERINNIRFGKNLVGYLFVDDWKGKSLAHGAQPDLINTEMWEYEDSRGNKTTQLLIAASKKKDGGFANFWWRKPDTGEERPKIVYAKGIPEWELFVGSGVYIDDIEQNIAILQEVLDKQTKTKIFISIIIVVIAFALFLIVFNLLSNRLRKDLNLFISFFDQAAFSDKKIDRETVQFVEFDQMAEYANKMLQDKMKVEIEREQAVEKVQELLTETTLSRDLLKTVINSTPDWIFAKDSDFRYTFVNNGYASALGRSPEDFIGKDDIEIGFSKEMIFGNLDKNIVGFRNDDKKALNGEKVHNPYDLATLADGVLHIFDTYKMPLTDIDGNIYAALGFARDITELKRAEESLKEYSERLEQMVEERTKELKDAQEQLVRREKLAILGQLAGGVGHELRNPLGVISNAVYYLKMVQPDAEETVKEYLETISEEVNRSTQIVSDLLDFSRVKSVEREETAVSDLIAEVLEKQPVPENVKVTSTIPSDLPPVFIDLRQIRQVFDNLITNACQAMPEGGKLSISAIAEQDKVHVSFTDTGSGISEENMEKVFEPLFTTKARGIGLGLAVSRNLVEANGGSIEVESEEDKGSTFTVILSCKEVA